MLCGTLGAQETQERLARFKQLFEVLAKIRKKCDYKLDVEVFEFIVHFTQRYGTFEMTRIVCEKMWQYEMVGNDEVER